MIALDEPLPERSRRVRADWPGSVESQAAPSPGLGAGGDSVQMRDDANKTKFSSTITAAAAHSADSNLR